MKEFAQEIEEKKTTRANVYLQWHMDWLERAKGAEQALMNMDANQQEDLSYIDEEVTWSQHCATMALKAYHCLLDPTLELPEECPFPPPQYALTGAWIKALWDSARDPDNNDDSDDYCYINKDDGFEDYDDADDDDADNDLYDDDITVGEEEGDQDHNHNQDGGGG